MLAKTEFKRGKKRWAGFTLLEIIIAITIMTLAFGAILTSQSQSIVLATKTKDLTLAGWLVHDAMVEAEHVMEGKPFNELKKSESGQFKDPYQRFNWTRELKEIKFPDLSQLGGDPKDKDKDRDAGSETARVLAKTLTKYLNDTVRELTVTVTWKTGKDERKVTLTTYLVDLNAEFNFAI